MKRRIAVLIASALAAAVVGSAVPAQAVDSVGSGPPWIISCLGSGDSLPPLGTVYTDENGIVHVNYAAVPGDADAISDWSYDKALAVFGCYFGHLYTQSVACNVNLAVDIATGVDPLGLNFRYVYLESGGFAVNVPQIQSDATTLVGCNLTINDRP